MIPYEKKENRFFNYLGQLRIYSLVDLILFSLAIGTNYFQMIGIVLLHLGFLIFLELAHKDRGRLPFPKYSWIPFVLVGGFLYQSFFALGFLIFGFLYSRKKLRYFEGAASFFRGLQYYFLSAGLLGFLHPVSLISGILLVFRNFAGDLRDVLKDRQEGIKTLPILLGCKKDRNHLHLIVLLGTSMVWCFIAGISPLWLIPVFVIEVGTYNWTPR